MATPNRWAIKEAGIATFYNLSTGKAMVTLSTLKTTGVETTGETVYAQGGRGNARIVGFSTNRQATLTLQDAIFDNQAIAMLTGNDLVSGVKKIDLNEVKSVTSNKFTLNKTPQGALVSVYKLNPDGTNGQEYTLGTPATNTAEYSITGKELTFHTTVTNGTQFRVYYQANTATDAKTIKVTSDQFGKSFRVVLDVLVVDEFTKEAFEGQLRIPNAKFQDNFNLSFAADGKFIAV
ncbi:hypothetical protein [Metabacillus arenae]|uniref:Uncharacterized protein n=1 Tax=Metabacillus arenae TaxID=2771434 RepID=A0A926RVS8_9BACI|nr:hypothetical protein [Metabacillus arenae]MBD1379216.1 hypothetical protein [Metabacillus arenae]